MEFQKKEGRGDDEIVTLGSLFDGIGGWQLATINAGITPVWSSEIEKFPLAVTATRFPKTKQLGDITKINGVEIEPVDIICAGSPCQDLSIAGGRKGLAGERSGLFRRAVDIVRDMRRCTRGEKPRFFVWENVPGALSSNKGADFRAVLEEIGQTEIPMPANGRWASAGVAELPKCQIAWRVLDAQYWGVPQRRKRIFLVADFRAAGRCAREILFEHEGVQGNFEKVKGAEKATAEGLAQGSYHTSTLGFDACASISNNQPVLVDKAPPLKANNRIAVYDIAHRKDVVRTYNDQPTTIAARWGTGGNNVPILFIAGNTIDRSTKNGGNGSGFTENVCYTLTATDRHAVFASQSFCEYKESRVGATLRATGGNYDGGSENLAVQSGVRRLTPLECERLQGLPDHWTLIDDKSCTDSARYKAIGNGMAQQCANFIIQRIKKEGCPNRTS